MDTCVVFYESWQMECCGIAFKIGDKVKWHVYKCNSFDFLDIETKIDKVDYFYDAHFSEDTEHYVLEGRVESIYIMYEKYVSLQDNPHLYQKYFKPNDNSDILVPISGILIESDRVEGFENPIDDMKLSGYLVNVVDYSIRTLKNE